MTGQSRLENISTKWTLMRQAHSPSDDGFQARQLLVLRYRPAVSRYVAAIVRSTTDAEDLTQDIVMRLLAGDFAGANPDRGRFRDLLKTAIRNMARSFWSRQKRRKTAALDTDTPDASNDALDAEWLAAWRKSVLDLAWKALQQEERSRSGSADYAVLRLRAKYPDDSSEELAVRLAKKTGEPIRADALRQKLRRARMRFVDLLIAEIGRSLADPTPERIEEELAALGLLEFVDDLLRTRKQAEDGNRR